MPKDKKQKEALELMGTLGDGAKDANTFVGTFINGIMSAGKSVSLQASQFYNNQSMVHIALSLITIPLAVYDLFNKYKELNEVKNKKFTQFKSSNVPDNYKHPEEINTEVFSLKKIQLSSSAMNILISLAFTTVVVATIFTGGLALGALALAALSVGIAKVCMDLYLQEKEKRLSKAFFESKVIYTMTKEEIEAYEKLDSKYRPIFIAKKALSLNNNNDFSDKEVKEYLLMNRQGHFENEKMRNTQFALNALSMSIWLTLCFVSAGIGGIIALGVTTLLSAGLSIVNTEKVQSVLSPKVTEWFRTFFSSKKDGFEELEELDYKNKSIDDVIINLKNIKQNTPPNDHPLTKALSALNNVSSDATQAPPKQYNSSATILINLNNQSHGDKNHLETKVTTPPCSNNDYDDLSSKNDTPSSDNDVLVDDTSSLIYHP